MMLLCSLEQQPNKPAGLPASVEDEVRREPKARVEDTFTRYLQFRGGGGRTGSRGYGNASARLPRANPVLMGLAGFN